MHILKQVFLPRMCTFFFSSITQANILAGRQPLAQLIGDINVSCYTLYRILRLFLHWCYLRACLCILTVRHHSTSRDTLHSFSTLWKCCMLWGNLMEVVCTSQLSRGGDIDVYHGYSQSYGLQALIIVMGMGMDL